MPAEGRRRLTALRAPAEEYGRSIGSSGLVVIGAFAVVVAWLALAGFLAVLAEALRRQREGAFPARPMAGGGVLAAAVGITGALPLLASTVMTGDGDLTPETAKALMLMNAAVFVLGWLLVAVPIGVASVSGMRLGVLGRGLGWAGAVVAVALAISSPAVWWVDGVVPVWLLALLWIVAAGIARFRRDRRVADPAAAGGVPAGTCTGAGVI